MTKMDDGLVSKPEAQHGLTRFDAKSVAVGALGLIVVLVAMLSDLPLAVVGMAAIAVGFYMAFRARNNRFLLYIFLIIFYACYSIAYANYLNPITDTMYTALRDSQYAKRGMVNLLLFLSIVALFLPKKINCFGYKSTLLSSRKQVNIPIVTTVLLILVVIMIYGFGRPDELGGERGTPSQIYEYAIILFIAAYYLAGQSKALRGLLTCLLFLFALQNLVYGGRIMALQFLTVWFFFSVSEKSSNRALCILVLVAFVMFTVVGNVRTEILSSSYMESLSTFGKNVERGFAWDTAYSAWYTSLTFYEYAELVPDNNLYLFSQWIASIFLGASAVPEGSLPILTHQYFYHWYGGVLPVYFDYYLGSFGVVLIGLFVAVLVNWINMDSGKDFAGSYNSLRLVSVLCCVYVAATVPRWFLYSPSSITRGLILCFLVCAVLLWIDSSMQKGKGRKTAKMGDEASNV